MILPTQTNHVLRGFDGKEAMLSVKSSSIPRPASHTGRCRGPLVARRCVPICCWAYGSEDRSC
jgi:hypothetical protein